MDLTLSSEESVDLEMETGPIVITPVNMGKSIQELFGPSMKFMMFDTV